MLLEDQFMKADVLLVDDDKLHLLGLRHILEKDGLSVLDAENGALALKVLEQSTVEIIITDLVMPVMGGIDLIKALKSLPENHSLPVIAMTGSNTTETTDQALSAGAVDILLKPFDEKILLMLIAKQSTRSF
jgi:CheY-like chemotaxis protein